jgi:hypothetical protein
MPPLETQLEPTALDGSMSVQGYRSLSVLAMVSLGLGLLSAVAIASPILGIVPLVAIVVSGVALRRISLDSERLSGRWMALVPLVLAPLFLGWGLTRDFSRRERFFAHARQFADDFLEILNRKEGYVAHQLKVPRKYRMDPHINLDAAYQRDENASREFATFIDDSPIKEILGAAPNVQFEFEGFLRHAPSGFVDTVFLQYSYQTPTEGKRPFWIKVRRTYSNLSDRADWNIEDISIRRPAGA